MIIETKPSLQLILDDAHNGKFNMAFDEDLFQKQIQSESPQIILRFYRFNEPILTVGYGMWRAANHSLSGQQAVRRPTGGGIVVHTPRDLTYSLITPLDSHGKLKKAQDSYYFIHDVLKNSFKSFGLDAELYQKCSSNCKRDKISYCFDSPVLHDVMIGDKKIAGAGQKRSFGYLLHQGSIVWDEVLCKRPGLNQKEFCDHFSKQLADTLNHG